MPFYFTEHPRRSECDCPFAQGRRVVCKHMIALYFSQFPHAAEKYHREVEAAQEAWENEQEEIRQRLIAHVHKMKKSELQISIHISMKIQY